jgi:nitrogen regulatory protein PII-like uncharacterized protein
MNQDDIIRMARQAGFELHQVFGGLIVRHSNGSWISIEREIERFAALVAAAEREACAKEINAEINDEIEDEAYCILVGLLARISSRGQQ